MSFFKSMISSLSGLDRIDSVILQSSDKADRHYRLHPTDHRNKGQVAVAESRVANIDYCSSVELHQKAQTAFRGLSDIAQR
ncbi:hypothetical protein JX580_05735 [Thiomicrospira microaerophila]|uniref:hypothetical protein n=1 Tax=Thiomicrospira microaerophila TaxID=406020 RepID=UPI00200DCB53|nr:hypothetical protein [Thiomicrospira microaerophila]UQB43360.1 hypothetical protein JX580_05735 [Thiomicrospira microaerophila]